MGDLMSVEHCMLLVLDAHNPMDSVVSNYELKQDWWGADQMDVVFQDGVLSRCSFGWNRFSWLWLALECLEMGR